MEPSRVVTAAELRSALIVTPLVLAFVVLADLPVVPGAAVAGLVIGPAVVLVKNVVIDDRFRRGAFVLLVAGLIGGLAFVGYLAVLVWLLVGYNVATGGIGIYERRVRPLVA